MVTGILHPDGVLDEEYEQADCRSVRKSLGVGFGLRTASCHDLGYSTPDHWSGRIPSGLYHFLAKRIDYHHTECPSRPHAPPGALQYSVAYFRAITWEHVFRRQRYF